MANRVTKCCARCGSDQVTAEARAKWNTTTQEWELADVEAESFGAVCAVCEDATQIKDAPLTGKPLSKARARDAALAHGWLPGDEDTAEQFCRSEGLRF